jgi:hypothetical protein
VRYRINCHHPEEDLARSGYKVDIKYQPFCIYGYTLKTKYWSLAHFCILFLTSGSGNPPKSLHLSIFLFKISIFGKFLPVKETRQ